MDADLLLQILNFIHPISARLQERILSSLVEHNLPKKHLLLRAGEVSKKIYFIKNGFARAWYQTRSGKECTNWFMGRGDLMISVYSFYTQQPSGENIELLEDSTVQSMNWASVQGLYADFPEFNLIGRILTEKYYIASEQRAMLLRTGTALERYELLLQMHPHILQKVPLWQIASHLNVSHEALSRLRNRQFQ
jgi:CRP-like cAMP-binding protein